MREAMAQLGVRRHANRARARRVRDEGTQPPTTCRGCGATYPRGEACELCEGDTQGRRVKDVAEIF